MNNTVTAQTIVKKADQELWQEYCHHLEQQPQVIQLVHRLIYGLKAAAMAINFSLLVLGIFATISRGRLGLDLSIIGEVWASYGLSWSFIIFPLALDALIVRAFPPVLFPKSFLHSSGKLHTGSDAVWRSLGALFGGMPGAVYMVAFFTDVLPRIIEAL